MVESKDFVENNCLISYTNFSYVFKQHVIEIKANRLTCKHLKERNDLIEIENVTKNAQFTAHNI